MIDEETVARHRRRGAPLKRIRVPDDLAVVAWAMEDLSMLDVWMSVPRLTFLPEV
jgi:hypothetical protein